MKKTILITGASTGIGNACATLFAEKGWNVAATMRTPEKNELAETESLKKFRLDVQDKASIQEAVDATIAAFGQIDVVLNNAGYGTAGAMETATDEQIRRQFDVNLFGVIDVMKATLPHFRERKAGLYLNVSSIGGLITFPIFSLYHSTKWALEGLTESLQYELNPLGIELKMIEPGGVKTDFATRSLDLFDTDKVPDYTPTVDKIKALFAPDTGRDLAYSTSEQMADMIYEAATDGKKQFRYICGADAQEFWAARQNMPYEDFRGMIKKNLLGEEAGGVVMKD